MQDWKCLINLSWDDQLSFIALFMGGIMAFFSEKEQLQKFEEEELAESYFEVLRELIAKKSIFAQQIVLKEVADYWR